MVSSTWCFCLYNYAHPPSQPHVHFFNCKELASVGSQTYGHYEIIGLFQNVLYVVAFVFVTFLTSKSDIAGLKNVDTADVA
jgi:hypothetical protein